MRSGAWLAMLTGLLFSACSGDYPLPPTACDNYCHATKGLLCQFYEPAACVSDCEQQMRGSEACAPQMNALVTCFVSNDAAARRCANFGFLGTSGEEALCDTEIFELELCSSVQRGFTQGT